MTGEQKAEKSDEVLEVGPKTGSLEVLNVSCGGNDEPSPVSSLPLQGVGASCTRESASYYEAVPEQGICYLPATNYGEIYLGCNETYPKWDDQGVYCMPSYMTYASGEVTSYEDQSLGHQPYMSTSGYIQQPYLYGSEQMPIFTWDSEQGAGYSQAGPNIHDNLASKASNVGPAPSIIEDPNLVKTMINAEVNSSSTQLDSVPHSNVEDSNLVRTKITAKVGASSKPLELRAHPDLDDPNLIKENITAGVKASSKPSDPRLDQLAYSSKSSVQHSQSLYKGTRSTSSIQPVGFPMEYPRSTNVSSPSYRGQCGFLPRNNFRGTRSTCQTINSNSMQMREKSNLRTRYEDSSELVIGPRADREMNSSRSSLKNELSPFLCRDHFNKPDFQTKYERAKFFMIKSYSEDDIHKSIKYSVWSSTPNGNSKLDAAFLEAETAALEKGTKCPVFLFFSVNASGQFVGLAEMTGPVDFKKKMDFWQQDKWNGFFPVTWHIIKDIPNRNFQHITLENNDNKPVPFSRDTQEIKLRQGLQMLFMFKSYPLRRSVLDDFQFYENREKSLHNTRNNQSTLTCTNVDLKDYTSTSHLERAVGEMYISGRSREPHSAPNYTPNFSRNPTQNYRQSVNRS